MEHIHVMIRDHFLKQKLHTNKFNKLIFGMRKNRTGYIAILEATKPENYDILRPAVEKLIFLSFDNLFKNENKNEENNFNPSGLNLQTGDGDAGPAPLQNNVNVTEDFEGIINFGNNCCVSNASTAENVVDETIHSIQSNAQNHVDRTRETITFRQSDVLKLNRFL